MSLTLQTEILIDNEYYIFEILDMVNKRPTRINLGGDIFTLEQSSEQRKKLFTSDLMDKKHMIAEPGKYMSCALYQPIYDYFYTHLPNDPITSVKTAAIIQKYNL